MYEPTDDAGRCLSKSLIWCEAPVQHKGEIGCMMDDRAMESRVRSEENVCTNEGRGDGPKTVQRSTVSRTKDALSEKVKQTYKTDGRGAQRWNVRQERNNMDG